MHHHEGRAGTPALSTQAPAPSTGTKTWGLHSFEYVQAGIFNTLLTTTLLVYYLPLYPYRGSL